MQQKKTIEEIKDLYPGLELRVWEGGVDIGYPEPGDLFNVQGTGSTPEQAWDDAYQCLTNTGEYSKHKVEKVRCDVSMDVNPDGEYWIYLKDPITGNIFTSVQVSSSSASIIERDLKLLIGQFPF